MTNKIKIIGRLISFSLIILIFYFLGRNLFLNWGQIKEYQFSLNYFNLIVSFIFLALGFLVRGSTWKKIVDFLQPDNDLGYLEVMRIEVFSQLGKYLPGKVFGPIGKAYLARNKKIFKKNLYFSVILDALLDPIAAFLLSLFLIGFFFPFKINLPNFYLTGLVVVILGLTVTHPKIFSCLINFFLTKIKKEPIRLDFNLDWLKKIKIILYYSLANFLMGLGFFYLINSLTYLSLQSLLPIIGIYVLAGILGFLAFFAPGGLGVREGTLVLFLQFYFPLNVAILISLLARIWSTLLDIILAGGFYLFDKVKNNALMRNADKSI